MRIWGTWVLTASTAWLLWTSTAESMWAAQAATKQSWTGETVGRMVETSQLSRALSVFFGRTEVKTDADARAPGVGPLLLNQFSIVDFPREKLRLPSGRLILDGWDRQSGSHAIVVPEVSDVTSIAAAALLSAWEECELKMNLERSIVLRACVDGKSEPRGSIQACTVPPRISLSATRGACSTITMQP